MLKKTSILTLAVLAAIILTSCSGAKTKYRRITVDDYIDKMKAGWVGQMAGVGWGAPTEFAYKGAIMPENFVPKWNPQMVNQFEQDDIYVEMTFIRTLQLYGLDVSIRQAGIDFANSGYELWHANLNGRANLRLGIAPPDSGHPRFNRHADDIDYQIEADYSGLIAPGLPQRVITLGELFGRLMNYGDGLYGGQFVGAMYSCAFFEKDPEKIIKTALKCIPKGSQYHQCITDTLKWYKQYPDNWQKAWQLIEDKYHKNPDYRRFSCHGADNIEDIDAKLNGAYIVMGLLYGRSDPDRTIIISTRCGQDSDCNPSSAAGILFTTLGFANLPPRFTSALDPGGKFSHTPYTFSELCEVCEQLTRKVVIAEGGRIQFNDKGREVFLIPIQTPRPGELQQCFQPGPIADSKFTEDEMAKIKKFPPTPQDHP